MPVYSDSPNRVLLGGYAMRFGVQLALCALLGGCSIVDTGEIDYRRAELPTNPSERVARYLSNDCKPQEVADITSGNPPQFDARREQACLPLLAGRLFRKNTSTPGAAIKPKDIYSIRLEHGLVAFMTEPGFDPSRLFYDVRRVQRQVGEIVVLANVFEFGEGDADQRFSDLTDLSQVKVIYYSPDVEARQDLNFSNIPLRAPAEYKGRPIGVQLIVIELDRMSSQMQSLLKTLAGLGQQSNLAPSGAASSLLLNLGTSMLTQNNDDTIFEYRFVLDPSDGSLSSQSAPFEAGRYVIKRTHDRDKDQIWRNLIVDHNTGRLMLVAGATTAAMVQPTPYTADTYFTLNVIKHPTGTNPGGYGFRTLDELGKDIEAESAKRDAPFADVQTALEAKLLDMRRTSRVADLLPAWNVASAKFRDFGRSQKPTSGECKTVGDYEIRLSQLEYEATRAAVDFHRLYREAVAEKDAKDQLIFGTEHKLRFLSALAPYFMPQTDGSVQIAELTNPDSFDATYAAADDPTKFVSAMRAMADGPRRARSCDELIAAQLAEPAPPIPVQ